MPVVQCWCRWQDSNLRPGAYETPALPLSYIGKLNDGGNMKMLLYFRFIFNRCRNYGSGGNRRASPPIISFLSAALTRRVLSSDVRCATCRKTDKDNTSDSICDRATCPLSDGIPWIAVGNLYEPPASRAPSSHTEFCLLYTLRFRSFRRIEQNTNRTGDDLASHLSRTPESSRLV